MRRMILAFISTEMRREAKSCPRRTGCHHCDRISLITSLKLHSSEGQRGEDSGSFCLSSSYILLGSDIALEIKEKCASPAAV